MTLNREIVGVSPEEFVRDIFDLMSNGQTRSGNKYKFMGIFPFKFNEAMKLIKTEDMKKFIDPQKRFEEMDDTCLLLERTPGEYTVCEREKGYFHTVYKYKNIRSAVAMKIRLILAGHGMEFLDEYQKAQRKQKRQSFLRDIGLRFYSAIQKLFLK